MRKITESPKTVRSPQFIRRTEEIEKCLELEPKSGYEIVTSNIGAWKSAFYKRWKDLKDAEKAEFLKLETQDEMKNFKWKYTNMEISITSVDKKITVWRES